jgi:hypothetical protein
VVGLLAGGWAGAVIAIMVALAVLGGRRAMPHPAVIPSFLVAGAIAGAAAGAVAGTRELRGKAAVVLFWAAHGAAIGFVPGFVLLLAAVSSPRMTLVALLGPVALCAIAGGIAGRVHHGGRVTVGELTVWVAVVAVALAILRSLWP